jgi:hypothetical protein
VVAVELVIKFLRTEGLTGRIIILAAQARHLGSWHKVLRKSIFPPVSMRERSDSTTAPIPYPFRDTLIKLIEAPVLEYKKLTSDAA